MSKNKYVKKIKINYKLLYTIVYITVIHICYYLNKVRFEKSFWHGYIFET